MIWNETNPADNDLMTTVIPRIHEAKEMIRERAVAFNGTFNEHNDADSDRFGQHIPSKVSWVKWHTNYAAIEAFCVPLVDFESTLHFDLDSNILYTIRDGVIFQLAFTDHSDLEIDNAEADHSQYIVKEKPTVPYEESGIELNASSLTVTTADNLLTSTHSNQDFETAHETLPTITNIADNSIHFTPNSAQNIESHNEDFGEFLYSDVLLYIDCTYPSTNLIGNFFGCNPALSNVAKHYGFTAL